MAGRKEDVYATLLLNDAYLPGALVLAHSLKDAGTTKKLAVLVTTDDSVSVDSMVQLQTIYDYIIPVDRIVNESPANLQLMDRRDLHSAFTKITLWKQEQFRRIVYMDADMVALRAPDELFNLAQPFSAAPDIGWPDLFNTGLMVLEPNMGDYYAMLAMAQRGISFDGADQGLINMHFKNTYNRLSFSYNVTPSAHYQYLPAYRHFQSSISAAHFIGKDKPWTLGRDAYRSNDPYGEMLGRWWSVYDKHYRASAGKGVPYIIQFHVKGEYQPQSYSTLSTDTREISSPASPSNYAASTLTSAPEPFHERIEEVKHEVKHEHVAEPTPVKKPDFVAPMSSWDASRAPPPSDSKPEASSFQATHYEMSKDRTPFKAPARYPEPPKNMYYEVPKTPTYQKPPPIFPWEKDAPAPTRVFAEDDELPSTGSAKPAEEELEIVTPTPIAPIVSVPIADPWQSFNTTRGNAWDDIPEIERYIGALQKNRKGNIQVLQGYGTGISQVSSPGAVRPMRSVKLTDFPTELERPSLPVTPAPIRRPSFWGEERDDEGELPAAEGVPAQADWVRCPNCGSQFSLASLNSELKQETKPLTTVFPQDPAAQLEMLARRQSDVLANKLGKGTEVEIPQRPLPFGSEGVKSPTYVPQGPIVSSNASRDVAAALSETVQAKEPSYGGPSAQFEKNEEVPRFETAVPPSEEEKDVLMT